MERINNADLVLKQGCTSEFVISQLQYSSDKILCLRNGWQLLWYHDSKLIPSDIHLEYVKDNNEIETQEFHYRCSDGDLYVFFLPELSAWIQSGRRGLFMLTIEGERDNEEVLVDIDNEFPSSVAASSVHVAEGNVESDEENNLEGQIITLFNPVSPVRVTESLSVI